jgi:C-terminal processing protease CtpA/Prc
VDVTTASGAPLPLHRQRTEDNYWFTVIEDARTLYLQYRRCRHGPEPFGAFAERVFRQLDQGAVDRLVVDVRHNGGGDSAVDDALVSGLQGRAAWRAPGRLFCIIGPATYSSGLWTANDLRQLGAVLVGSPTGGKPNSYGNVQTLTLPNSGIPVNYSTREFRIIQGDDPAWLAPALPAEPTIDDVRAGRDPVLEAAIAFRP